MKPWYEDFHAGSSDYPLSPSVSLIGVAAETSLSRRTEEINSILVFDAHRYVDVDETNRARFSAIVRRIRPEVRVNRLKLFRVVAIGKDELITVRLVHSPGVAFPTQDDLKAAGKSAWNAKDLVAQLSTTTGSAIEFAF